MLSATATRALPPALLELCLDAEQTGRAYADSVVEGRFTFNYETYRLEPGFDWTANPSADIEWLILLHKFYYAPGLGRAWAETGDRRYLDCWMDLTRGWMDSTPVGFLTSDVAGRRLQNWAFAWQYFADVAPPAFEERFLESIRQQAQRLRDNLTPARNHRTLELLALLLTAIQFPEIDGAAEWLEFTRHEMAANLRSDLRADGVHIEQSTDYHHIVLRNALAARLATEANGIEMGAGFDESLRRALEFALFVHRPDGMIPSLSDGDSGSFLGLLELGYRLYGDPRYRWVASKGRSGAAPAERLKAFPAGGYYILRSGWGERERFEDERFLVFDCGPLGEGNHGHLDLLSFELYAYGRPLVVDPGRYTYDESGDINWRVLFRGTSWHNTVTVDGRNQTRYEFHKRKFKIRGPQPEYGIEEFVSRDGQDAVCGWARSAEYDVLHRREIRMVNGTHFEVRDRLESATPHHYDLWFHLSAEAEGRISISRRDGSWRIETPHLVMTQAGQPGVACTIERGWVSETYGRKLPAPVVRFRLEGTTVEFTTLLYPRKEEN